MHPNMPVHLFDIFCRVFQLVLLAVADYQWNRFPAKTALGENKMKPLSVLLIKEWMALFPRHQQHSVCVPRTTVLDAAKGEPVHEGTKGEISNTPHHIEMPHSGSPISE